MERVYLAARYPRKYELMVCAEQLRGIGLNVTSSWLDEPHAPDVTLTEMPDDELRLYASRDLHDVDSADTLIFFAESPMVGIPRGGRHVELGYALAKNKRIIIIGDRENIFHYLPGIERAQTWRDLYGTISKELTMKA